MMSKFGLVVGLGPTGLRRLGQSLALPNSSAPPTGRAKLLLSRNRLRRLGRSLALPNYVASPTGRAKLPLSRNRLRRLGRSLALPDSSASPTGRAKLPLSRNRLRRLGRSLALPDSSASPTGRAKLPLSRNCLRRLGRSLYPGLGQERLPLVFPCQAGSARARASENARFSTIPYRTIPIGASPDLNLSGAVLIITRGPIRRAPIRASSLRYSRSVGSSSPPTCGDGFLSPLRPPEVWLFFKDGRFRPSPPSANAAHSDGSLRPCGRFDPNVASQCFAGHARPNGDLPAPGTFQRRGLRLPRASIVGRLPGPQD